MCPNTSQHHALAPVAPPPILSPGRGTATLRKYHYGCNGNYQYRQATTTVCSKTLLLHCFSGKNIQEILWIRTKNSELLMQSNTTSSDIIIKLFIWVTFKDQKKWKKLADKTTHTGTKFHSIIVQSKRQKGFLNNSTVLSTGCDHNQ
jgi:hypothetical protein